VILAAQLGALAVIFAHLGRLEPGFIQPARDRIDLDAEGRDRERVNNIGPDGLDADDLVHWHHDLVVDREQARRIAFGARLVAGKQRIELELAAMPTRIRTGTSVQATSIRVL
jgi:hypothetical protein